MSDQLGNEDRGPNPELLEADELIAAGDDAPSHERSSESVEQPAKVMRVGSMMRQLLEELRGVDLDELSRERLKDIYETSITELGSALSPELHQELIRLSSPFDDANVPSESELIVAKAQLVGWLEGLIQGIQAMLFAQQAAAQQQLASMRGQLQAGPQLPGGTEDRPGGTYL